MGPEPIAFKNQALPVQAAFGFAYQIVSEKINEIASGARMTAGLCCSPDFRSLTAGWDCPHQEPLRLASALTAVPAVRWEA